MSGRTEEAIVDFAAILYALDRVCRVPVKSLLVRGD